MKQDTIFAQSSAKGKSGVAVFRISGDKSLSALKKLCKKELSEKNLYDTITPRRVYYRTIYCPVTSQAIDNSLVVYFKGNKSFTGEDTVEIYVHGSIAVCKMLTRSLLNIEGIRLAEPGEFAKRSFLNGKMDLTSAEGLADLIAAETTMQHKQAIKQMGGELEKLYNSWRKELITIASLIEVYIDFPDEEIPGSVLENAKYIIDKLKNNIANHLEDKRKGERLREGIKIVIIGEANVGKSTLMNYLTMREVAIVSNIPGTTRDVIQTYLDIKGYPIILCDTAGIRSNIDDPIECEGIKRTLQIVQTADIKILMFDVLSTKNLNKEVIDLHDDYTIIVINKTDLGSYDETLFNGKETLKISLQNKDGLNNLIDKIVQLAEKIADPGDSPTITRERYRNSLKKALVLLNKINLKDDLILAAEDIRIVIRCLEHITGKVKIDDILEKIFANFCIGK